MVRVECWRAEAAVTPTKVDVLPGEEERDNMKMRDFRMRLQCLIHIIQRETYNQWRTNLRARICIRDGESKVGETVVTLAGVPAHVPSLRKVVHELHRERCGPEYGSLIARGRLAAGMDVASSLVYSPASLAEACQEMARIPWHVSSDVVDQFAECPIAADPSREFRGRLCIWESDSFEHWCRQCPHHIDTYPAPLQNAGAVMVCETEGYTDICPDGQAETSVANAAQ